MRLSCLEKVSTVMGLRTWLVLGSVGVIVSVGAGCTAEPTAHELLGATQQAVGETITTDKAAYTVGENVIVSFTNLPGNAYDWVALSPQGSPNTSYTRWAYVSGKTSGSITFSGPPAGDYVARVYENNSFTVLATSAPFTIAPQNVPATISVDKATYQPSEFVQVAFAGMAGYDTDWISIAPQGSPANGYVKWAYTQGRTSGTIALPLGGLSGTYVARAHINNGFTIDAESAPFTVAASGTTVTADKAAYAFGETITVSYANMAGAQKDWISIAVPGAADDEFSWWEYTAGKFNGTVTLSTLPQGTYVARVYFDDGFTKRAESASFTVGAPPQLPVTLSTNKTSYNGLEAVLVTYTGMADSGSDWIGAYETSGDMRRFAAFTYTWGVNNTAPFYGLPYGSWQIRAFFDNNFVLQGQTAGTINVTAAVEAEKPSFTTAEPIRIRFGGMKGASQDWIGVYRQGAANNAFYAFQYTQGEILSARSFNAAQLGTGTFVARVFFDNSLTMQAESAPFTIQ